MSLIGKTEKLIIKELRAKGYVYKNADVLFKQKNLIQQLLK